MPDQVRHDAKTAHPGSGPGQAPGTQCNSDRMTAHIVIPAEAGIQRNSDGKMVYPGSGPGQASSFRRKPESSVIVVLRYSSGITHYSLLVTHYRLLSFFSSHRQLQCCTKFNPQAKRVTILSSIFRICSVFPFREALTAQPFGHLSIHR